jgi:hypothetical protein
MVKNCGRNHASRVLLREFVKSITVVIWRGALLKISAYTDIKKVE